MASPSYAFWAIDTELVRALVASSRSLDVTSRKNKPRAGRVFKLVMTRLRSRSLRILNGGRHLHHRPCVQSADPDDECAAAISSESVSATWRKTVKDVRL